jgi:lysophospholipase L1-like esterase
VDPSIRSDSGEGTSPVKPRAKAILFRTVAITCGVILPLVVLEVLGAIGLHYEELPTIEAKREQEKRHSVAVRDRGIATVSDPYLLYRVQPNAEHAHATINEYGLRGGPITRQPGRDTFRILLQGGSVAWGYSARSNQDTISALLQAYLGARTDSAPALIGKKIEVLNAAVFGYVAWQEALAYALHHRDLEPDVIISLDGANEVMAAIRSGRAGVPARYSERIKPFVAEKPTLWGNLREWLVYRFHRMKIVRYLNGREEPRLAITRLLRRRGPRTIDAYGPPTVDEVSEAYRRALEFLSDLARADGALVVPVLQPMSILTGTKPLDPSESDLVRTHEAEIPGQNAYYNRSFAAFRAMFEELADERPDLLLLDATGVFADRAEVIYVDQCHLTQRGREILAEWIGSALLERLNREDQRGYDRVSLGSIP